MVECNLAKVDVVGSSPIARSRSHKATGLMYNSPVRKIVAAFLIIFTIYGCGVATKDTGSNLPESDLLVFTDKGISEGRISNWSRNIGQSAKTFQGTPQDILKNGQELYLATTSGLYICTNNLITFTKILTANVVDLHDTGTHILAATDRGCFISTENLQYDLITSANSYQKILAQRENVYVLNKYGLWVASADVSAWQYASTEITENIQDFGFCSGQLVILTNDNLYFDNEPSNLPLDNPERLFITGTQIWLSGKTSLSRSTDNGKNWLTYDRSVNYNAERARDVLLSGLQVYVSAENGVWYTLNGGESWKVLRKQNGILSNNAVKTLLR